MIFLKMVAGHDLSLWMTAFVANAQRRLVAGRQRPSSARVARQQRTFGGTRTAGAAPRRLGVQFLAQGARRLLQRRRRGVPLGIEVVVHLCRPWRLAPASSVAHFMPRERAMSSNTCVMNAGASPALAARWKRTGQATRVEWEAARYDWRPASAVAERAPEPPEPDSALIPSEKDLACRQTTMASI